jgi:hypothetical protein
MREFIIQIDREDAKIVEEEERNIFIKSVLNDMGIPLDELWPEDELNIENKVKLREFLRHVGVDILDDRDRGVKIYAEGELVAEWYKPTLIMKEDVGAINRTKRFYFEIKAKCWSVFEK